MFPYFIENNLTSENQSGFKKFYSKDSITHEIFYSFHDNYEITKLEVYIYIYIYIYILTLSAYCINVKFILIIQGDIFLKSVKSVNLQRTVINKRCKKVYTN